MDGGLDMTLGERKLYKYCFGFFFFFAFIFLRAHIMSGAHLDSSGFFSFLLFLSTV